MTYVVVPYLHARGKKPLGTHIYVGDLRSPRLFHVRSADDTVQCTWHGEGIPTCMPCVTVITPTAAPASAPRREPSELPGSCEVIWCDAHEDSYCLICASLLEPSAPVTNPTAALAGWNRLDGQAAVAHVFKSASNRSPEDFGEARGQHTAWSSWVASSRSHRSRVDYLRQRGAHLGQRRLSGVETLSSGASIPVERPEWRSRGR